MRQRGVEVLYENVVTPLMRQLSRSNVLCMAVKVADGLAHCSFDRHSGLVGNDGSTGGS